MKPASSLYSQSNEIIQTVITRALEGDPVALRLTTERLVPVFKAVDLPVTLLGWTGGSQERAEGILRALQEGGC